MGYLAGSVLGASVATSGPVSRPLASLANASMQLSSTHRIQLPIVLDFNSDEGKIAIREWYRQQPATEFEAIEYHKERDGVGHEFVVVCLGNSTFCRFDRRAREDKRGHAFKASGTTTEDTAHVIARVDRKAKADLGKSKVLARVYLSQRLDLRFILTVCYGIQLHPKAKSYSLLYYNCYFFSWTLVVAIARQDCKWEKNVMVKQLLEKVADTLITQTSFLDSPSLRCDGRKASPEGLERLLTLLRGESSEHAITRQDCKWEKSMVAQPEGLERFLSLLRGEPPEHVDGTALPSPNPIFNIYREIKEVKRKLRITPPSKGLVLAEYLSPQSEGLGKYSLHELKSALGTFSTREIMEKALNSCFDGIRPGYLEALLLRSQLWAVLIQAVLSALSSAQENERMRFMRGPELNGTTRLMLPVLILNDILQSQYIEHLFANGLAGPMAWTIKDVLLSHLPDPMFVQPGPGFKGRGWNGDTTENKEATSQSLQEYIERRMWDHFARVEDHALGIVEELVEQAEDSMCEIWVSVVEMMKDESQLNFL